MKSFSDRDERPIAEEMDVPPDPSRSWTRSLWLHVGLLALVLVALIPVVGSTGIYSVDEGAALAQATQLRRTGHWSLPNDFPAADPRGRAYVLDKSTQTPAGFAPLTKHPAYPRLLALADQVGGRVGIVLVGVLATVVAAALAALIARCIHEDLAVPALWVAGIGSPLLFDSYLVIAHTLGAAGAGLAALGVLRHRRHPHWTALVMVAVGSALAIAMRAEGLLFGLALGAAAGLLALWRARGSVRDAARASTPAVVAVVASVVAFLVDRQATLPHLVGVVPSTQDTGPSYGLVAGRVSAFVTTWLEPSYGGGLGFLLPAALAVVTLVVVLEVRRHPGDGGLLRAGVVAITVTALAWMVLSPTTVVPGLLCAFPLLVAGLAAWRRSLFRNDDIVLLAGTVALFAAAVLATEYPQGGGAEWGARYLALAVPLAVPLVLEPLRRLRRRLPEANRRVGDLRARPARAGAGVRVHRRPAQRPPGPQPDHRPGGGRHPRDRPGRRREAGAS